MATKLYVGGLSYGTTEDGLRDYFAQAGEVASSTIIKDKFTGRSKGFGFVEYTDDSVAQKAVEMFHGQEFEGRTLTVNEARPMEARPPRKSFDRGGDRGGRGGYNGGGGARTSSW
jgi:cold-inducible RNA-binding protein